MSNYTLVPSYVGSKASYIAKIKACFDPTATKYVEPFVGAGAVYFSNYNGKYEKEWINDANVNIAIMYKALADKETRDEVIENILAIRKDNDEAIARAQFDDAKKNMTTDKINYISKYRYPMIAANTYRILSQSFNCAGKNYSTRRSNEKYQREVKRNLKNAMERLATEPKITNKDGIKIIKKKKHQPEIQFLIDPPYVGLYRNSSKLYLKEMAGLYKHIQMAEALNDSKAAVVLCGYRSQYDDVPTVYDALLTGEEWHCFKIADTYKHCEVVKPGEVKKKACEFIWTNRVPKNAGLYISLHDYKEKITIDEYWERIKNSCSNGDVPKNHIVEYESTYEAIYGKKLLEDN